MGMYLPMSLTLVIPIGALLGRSYDKWADRTGGDDVEGVEQKKRLGVLMATGLIVGESLFGVVFAGIVAASGSDSPLAVVGKSFASWAEILGVVLFVAVVAGLYKWTRRTATVD
jgi:predicted metal-binding membrane protein